MDTWYRPILFKCMFVYISSAAIFEPTGCPNEQKRFRFHYEGREEKRCWESPSCFVDNSGLAPVLLSALWVGVWLSSYHFGHCNWVPADYDFSGRDGWQVQFSWSQVLKIASGLQVCGLPLLSNELLPLNWVYWCHSPRKAERPRTIYDHQPLRKMGKW